MKLAEALEGIAAAVTTTELESAFQAAISAFPIPTKRRTNRRIHQAVIERGNELALASPHSRLIPQLGLRRRLTVCGKTYSVGYGQNSTGERYVWTFAERWIKEKLTEAGLAPEVADAVVSWWRCGYPHRALRAVEESQG